MPKEKVGKKKLHKTASLKVRNEKKVAKLLKEHEKKALVFEVLKF
jgi:hypothetical protein